jgi:hypothetical protein
MSKAWLSAAFVLSLAAITSNAQPYGPSTTLPTLPSPSSDTASATPPMHRHARHVSHGKMAAHHPSRYPKLQGNSVANQLNQAELNRLQAGNFSNPAAPPGPGMPPLPRSAAPPR